MYKLRREWDLHSSGLLRGIYSLFTDMLEQRIGPTLKGQDVKFSGSLLFVKLDVSHTHTHTHTHTHKRPNKVT